MFCCLIQCLIAISVSRELLSTDGIDYYGLTYSDLPRAVDYAAVGCSSSNENVIVLGGSASPRALITIDINTYNFTDHGENYLNSIELDTDIYTPSTEDAHYISQFYTQLDVEYRCFPNFLSLHFIFVHAATSVYSKKR